jgi:hypothetical protein
LEARFESFCLQAGRVAEKQGKKAIGAEADSTVVQNLSS